MKKIFLILFVFLLSYGGVRAQEAFIFGIKGGVNFANLGGDFDYDTKSKTGFHLGLVAEFPLTERFSLQPEVLYSSQGTKMDMSGTEFGMPYSMESTATLDYINVPVLAKFYVFEGLSLELGPQIGFLVKAEDEYSFSFDGETESGTDDIKEDLKSTDFGLAAGVGYKLTQGIFFNARYILGLSDIQGDEGFDGEFDEDVSIKNNVFQFSVGFMF